MNDIILLISFIITIIFLLVNYFIKINKIKKLKTGDIYINLNKTLNPFEEKEFVIIIELKYNFKKKLYVKYRLVSEEKLYNKIYGFLPTKILSAKSFVNLYKKI